MTKVTNKTSIALDDRSEDVKRIQEPFQANDAVTLFIVDLEVGEAILHGAPNHHQPSRISNGYVLIKLGSEGEYIVEIKNAALYEKFEICCIPICMLMY